MECAWSIFLLEDMNLLFYIRERHWTIVGFCCQVRGVSTAGSQGRHDKKLSILRSQNFHLYTQWPKNTIHKRPKRHTRRKGRKGRKAPDTLASVEDLAAYEESGCHAIKIQDKPREHYGAGRLSSCQTLLITFGSPGGGKEIDVLVEALEKKKERFGAKSSMCIPRAI